MSLKNLRPTPVMSVIEPGKHEDGIPLLVAVLIVGPPLILKWSYQWAYVIAGGIASTATMYFLAQYRQKMRIKDALSGPLEVPAPTEYDEEARASLWKDLLSDYPIKSFVLFAYGTCVFFTEDHDDPIEYARGILTSYGPAMPGTPTADMLVYTLPHSGDFAVGGHCPNILTLVPRNTFRDDTPSEKIELAAGMIGKQLRIYDTFTQLVVYSYPKEL